MTNQSKIITVKCPEYGHTFQYDLFKVGRDQISIHKGLDQPIKVPVRIQCPNCHKYFTIQVNKNDLPPEAR